jgi:hypothetical protein
VAAWSALTDALAALCADPAEAGLLTAAAALAASGDLATAVRRLGTGAAGLPDFADRESLAAARLALPPAPPRIPAQRSTVDEWVDPGAVRLRFGPGIPDALIEAARAPAHPRRGRSMRVLQTLVIALVLLLGAGAAAFAYLLLRP